MEESTVEALIGDDEIAGFLARLFGLYLGAAGGTISVLAEAASKVRRILPFGSRHDFSLCRACSWEGSFLKRERSRTLISLAGCVANPAQNIQLSRASQDMDVLAKSAPLSPTLEGGRCCGMGHGSRRSAHCEA